jgi:hypothetical protein
MRENQRLDGCVVLTGDGDDHDQVVVEGIVTEFTPVRGNSLCICGAAMERWGCRPAVDGVEIYCTSCHRVRDMISLGIRVYR